MIDHVQKTRRKWAIDDFMKCSNNNFITLLIINIGAESAIHIEESFTIYCCQVNELDRPDIGDIDYVNKDVVSSWQEIIHHSGQIAATDANMEDNQFESNSSNHHNTAIRFLELLIDEIEMKEELLTKVEYSHISKNLQIIILCNTIQDWLAIHHL